MQKAPKKVWHKEDIKAAIRKKGLSLTALAITHSLPEASVRNALSRPLVSGEKAIASFLDVPLHELWPERWTKSGQRIRPRYAHKYTTNHQVAA